MDLNERLRASEQSRHLAWRVLQEIRLILEILADQRIPYEGELKRFRAEGDFLIGALVTLVSTNRSHIHRLETELGEIAKLADRLPHVPRELLKVVHDLDRQRRGTGLNPDQLRGCLDKLKELRVIRKIVRRTDQNKNSDEPVKFSYSGRAGRTPRMLGDPS
jgi:hypothetical protein